MLGRGMKNRDIQFHFNRPDRPVNTGRITQIRKGAYGPSVTAANSNVLDTFLQIKTASNGTVSAKKSVGERAKDHFHKLGTGWFLRTHETDEAECKTAFPGVKPADRASAIVRAVAGLANNKGGFVFLGVEELNDKSLKVAGLDTGGSFSTLDPAAFNQVLVATLDPVPVFQLGLAEIGGMPIGFIEVAKHDGAPIIATRNLGNDIREGGVYFRYVGETRLIRAGELRFLISQRERRAVESFAKAMGRVADGSAATLDFETGTIAGNNAQFLLDEDSLKKIQFLKEGDFTQKNGAPALKLVGDVRLAPSGVRVVRHNITQDDILRNFLSGELVAEPLQYILALAHTSRIWLPTWYYVQLSKMEIRDIIAALNRERPTQPSHRDGAISRLLGKKSAYKLHTGTPKKILSDILDGKVSEPKTTSEDSNFALAVQGLPETAQDIEQIRSTLTKVAARAQGNDPQTSQRRSNIFRAACRLDELLYRKRSFAKK